MRLSSTKPLPDGHGSDGRSFSELRIGAVTVREQLDRLFRERVKSIIGSVLAMALVATAASPVARIPVLVELFTSEGCSSCPPADALLALLDRTQPVAGADVIVLSEHVDYWNQLGWTDPYSSPAFSRRQQDYGTRFKLPSIYTPEMVVDGRSEFTGNDAEQASKEIQKALEQQKTQVTLSQPVRDGQQIKVHVEVAPRPGSGKTSAIVYVALAEEHALSHVTKGENGGAPCNTSRW